MHPCLGGGTDSMDGALRGRRLWSESDTDRRIMLQQCFAEMDQAYGRSVKASSRAGHRASRRAIRLKGSGCDALIRAESFSVKQERTFAAFCRRIVDLRWWMILGATMGFYLTWLLLVTSN